MQKWKISNFEYLLPKSDHSAEALEHGFLHPDQVRESVILLSLDKHGGVNAFLLKTHNLEFLAL